MRWGPPQTASGQNQGTAAAQSFQSENRRQGIFADLPHGRSERFSRRGADGVPGDARSQSPGSPTQGFVRVVSTVIVRVSRRMAPKKPVPLVTRFDSVGSKVTP